MGFKKQTPDYIATCELDIENIFENLIFIF